MIWIHPPCFFHTSYITPKYISDWSPINPLQNHACICHLFECNLRELGAFVVTHHIKVLNVLYTAIYSLHHKLHFDALFLVHVCTINGSWDIITPAGPISPAPDILFYIRDHASTISTWQTYFLRPGIDSNTANSAWILSVGAKNEPIYVTRLRTSSLHWKAIVIRILLSKVIRDSSERRLVAV
jgi:hypothetical protein